MLSQYLISYPIIYHTIPPNLQQGSTAILSPLNLNPASVNISIMYNKKKGMHILMFAFCA